MTILAVSAVVAVSVVTATPPFSDILTTRVLSWANWRTMGGPTCGPTHGAARGVKLRFGLLCVSPIQGKNTPEGPRIEKNQSREAILKKSSFEYGMKFSIENGFFIPSPSLAAEKQGPGLKFLSRE